MTIKDLYEKTLKSLKKINKKKDIEPKKVKMDILGISYSKTEEQNFYVVVLGEEGGERKIPVIINYYEAQSLAIEVEKILPIVPLVYDTFKEILTKHKIIYDEILITDFKNDILFTYFINKKEKIEVRTADALSMSVRMGYPIYIYEDILIKVDKVVQKYYDIKDGKQVKPEKDKLQSYSLTELENLLQESIDDEEYERASEIRDEIIKKKNS